MINVEKSKYYTEEEVKEILHLHQHYVYVDDGMTEVAIKKEDIPDYIVMVNREFGITNLKIIDIEEQQYPLITTMGEFLDKCEPNIREQIIDKLIKLQTGELEYKNVKVIDTDILEYIESQSKKFLIKIWETEEDRDLGESIIYETSIESIQEAITKAKKIMNEQNYASMEVQDSKEKETYYFCTPKEEQYFYNVQERDKLEKIAIVVGMYFAEKDITNLMNYGSDRDSLVMPTLTDLYKELMEKLNIQYERVKTDDVSHGNYETIVEFKGNKGIFIETSAWNSEEIIIGNMIDIQKETENAFEITQEEELEM